MSKSLLIPDVDENGVVTLYASPIKPITVFPQFFPQGTHQVRLILTNRPDSVELAHDDAVMRERWSRMSGWYEKLYGDEKTQRSRPRLFGLRQRIARWILGE